MQGELKCNNFSSGRLISHEAFIHQLIRRRPCEAAVVSVAVTDVDRVNVGCKLFPYGGLFQAESLCLGLKKKKKEQLSFHPLTTSSIQRDI